jgi:hypothetical protein
MTPQFVAAAPLPRLHQRGKDAAATMPESAPAGQRRQPSANRYAGFPDAELIERLKIEDQGDRFSIFNL